MGSTAQDVGYGSRFGLSLRRASDPVKHELPGTTSLLLDIVRFAAAVVVLVGHITVPVFGTGFPDLHVIGEYAVPVFFVLSGFVIRFVSRSREARLRDYLIDRAARVYSVALPAMLLTLILSAICFRLDKAYYVANFGPFSDHIVARVLMNLAFVSQSWGLTVIPLIDGPFWSLGYECIYYLGYGLLVYLRGPRRLAWLAVWMLIAGPQVLALAPIWYCGCLVYDLFQRLRRTRASAILSTASGAYLIVATGLAAAGKTALLLAPFRLIAVCGALKNPLEWLHISPGRASTTSMAIGLLSACAMLLLLLAADWLTLSSRNVWMRRFRHVADGTFSIYLLHFPLLVLFTELGLLRRNRLLLNVCSGIVIAVLLIVAARPFDMLRLKIRDSLRGMGRARGNRLQQR